MSELEHINKPNPEPIQWPPPIHWRAEGVSDLTDTQELPPIHWRAERTIVPVDPTERPLDYSFGMVRREPETADFDYETIGPEVVITHPIEPSKFTLSALVRALNEHRLERANARIKRLENSANVLTSAPKIVGRKQEPAYETHGRTILQRRQATRASRRQHRANNRRARNSDLRMVFGDQIEDAGYKPIDRIERRAQRYSERNKNVLGRITKRIVRAEGGEDIAGQITNVRLQRARKTSDKLRARLGLPPLSKESLSWRSPEANEARASAPAKPAPLNLYSMLGHYEAGQARLERANARGKHQRSGSPEETLVDMFEHIHTPQQLLERYGSYLDESTLVKLDADIKNEIRTRVRSEKIAQGIDPKDDLPPSEFKHIAKEVREAKLAGYFIDETGEKIPEQVQDVVRQALLVIRGVVQKKPAQKAS